MCNSKEKERSIEEIIRATNTCSSSDTDSDMESVVRERKRMKIKMRPKSPVQGYYSATSGQETKVEVKVHDRFSENQLDCSFGREAYDEMLAEQNSDCEEREFILMWCFTVISVMFLYK